MHSLAQDVLEVDANNGERAAYLRPAERRLGAAPTDEYASQTSPASDQLSSFSNGRHEVKRFLSESGKKKVYLAHDATLDREVAFALIKTEGLDET